MANIIRLKRTSVKGKVPTLDNIAVAELALNTRDGRLYSANTTHVYEIGSNPHNVTVGSGGFQIANGNITFPSTDGSAGHFLKTDGNGSLSFAPASASGSFNNSPFTGNTTFSDNSTF